MASVVLSYLHNGSVRGEFMRSVVNFLAYDVGHGGHVLGDGGFLHLPSGPNLSAPRCRLVRSFLDSKCEWLWMVDSDMTFPPDTLSRLLDCDVPIVGGLCFVRTYDDGQLTYFPTMFKVEDDGKSYRMTEYPPDTLVDVDATGTACLLMHRSVLEEMGRKYPEPLPWFAEEVNEWGGIHSEDVTFCLRARALGFQVKVHTGIQLGHVKAFEVNEQTFTDWRG